MLTCCKEAKSACHIVTNLSPEGLATLEIWLPGACNQRYLQLWSGAA
jgi:hypothetical protein